MIWLLLALVNAGLFLAVPILALVAFRRSRGIPELLRRIAALEREVRELRGSEAVAAPPVADAERAGAAEASVPPPIAPRPETVARPGEPPPEEPPTPEPPPRPVTAPPPPPPPPRAQVDWERLLGVRGAALVGGILLAGAGLLFFQYAIEHGLIPPWLRVVVGTVVGVGAIVGSERALRRRYAVTANALAGAGVVILYAAFWAAAVRYELIGLRPGFVLMLAVTVTCCALSWRHRAQVIAILGLAGGFATPLLLSTGADRPFGLFGYLLLLDLGLLYLAQARRWPWLGVASLVATVLYQALWIGGRMGPGRLALGLGILATFALVFAAAARRATAENMLPWRITQAAALLLPFAFALWLAGQARFGAHLLPYGLLLFLLTIAACWLSKEQDTHRLGLGAAGGGLGVVAVWLLARLLPLDAPLAWEAVAIAVALALVFQAFVEWEPARADADGPAPAAVVSGLGFLLLLVLGMVRSPGTPWPWVAGWAALAALLVRHATFARREALHLAAALALGFALAWLHAWRAQVEGPPPLGLYLALMVGAAVAFQGVALLRRGTAGERWAEHGAAAICVPLLLALVPAGGAVAPGPWPVLGTSLVLGALVALAAMRLGVGAWLCAAVGLTALVHTVWGGVPLAEPPVRAAATALALEAVAVMLFTAWPFLAAGRFRSDRFAWIASAVAGPAWFLSMKELWERRFGDDAIGLLPVLLAGVSLAATARVRDVLPAAAPLRTGTLALFAAVALGFVSVAIPLQLEREWITIGWALEGVAVVCLWTRLDAPGLKWFGLALFAAVTVRLVANPAVLGYYPRPEWRIVNWLLYTYMVPAAALLVGAMLLRPGEVARARAWERGSVYRLGQPIGALGAGLVGLVVVFVWINLAIADWFATGPTLTVSFERLPARDLATSIGWALYALVLLSAGVVRTSTGLRWVSLALLLVTIAKVFLHDLGELRDLYRVASLAGLAVSLFVVSLAYQRFVFRIAPVEKT